jgi:hypothetical protein
MMTTSSATEQNSTTPATTSRGRDVRARRVSIVAAGGAPSGGSHRAVLFAARQPGAAACETVATDSTPSVRRIALQVAHVERLLRRQPGDICCVSRGTDRGPCLNQSPRYRLDERASANQENPMSVRSALRTLFTTISLTAVVVGTAAVGAAPAHAAGGTANDIRVCFSYSNGSAYVGKPVYLYRSNGSSWVRTSRSGNANSNGCVTFVDVASHYHYAAQAYWSYSPNGGWTWYAYNGWSGSAWNGAARDALVTLPRGTVTGPHYLGG